jgi:hypothetical protein
VQLQRPAYGVALLVRCSGLRAAAGGPCRLRDYLSEGAKAGRNRDTVQDYLRQLKAAGLDQDFVITYLIAMGFRRDTRRVREHCDVAGIKKVHFKLGH